MSNKITVTASINAGIQKVWDYYNLPGHIVNWNFADPSWKCPSASNDLKVGGKYLARMEARDGSAGFDFGGTYLEVTELQKLKLKLDDGRIVDTTFTGNGETTTVTIVFDMEKEHPREMQEYGWQAILDNFKRYAESA